MRGFDRGTRRAFLSCGVAAFALALAEGVEPNDRGPGEPPRARPALEDKFPELKLARQGARERLARTECEAVLADFRDRAGRRLDDVLRAKGRTAPEQLDLLELESGFGHPECESRAVMAYTRVSSSVVSICLRQFRERGPLQQEAALIHEMLHSLGLGENPPESVAITSRVLDRCGH
jgi:hypothetical protein